MLKAVFQVMGKPQWDCWDCFVVTLGVQLDRFDAYLVHSLTRLTVATSPLQGASDCFCNRHAIRSTFECTVTDELMA